MGAKLDGEVLGDDWVMLEPGSRLEFGFACIALEFDAAPLTGVVAHEHEVPLAFLGTPLPSGNAENQWSAQDPAPASAPVQAKSAAKPHGKAPSMDVPQAISGNSAIITQHLLLDSLIRSLEAKSEHVREWLARASEQGRVRVVKLAGHVKQAFARVGAELSRKLRDLRGRFGQKRDQAAARVAKPRSRRTRALMYALIGAIIVFAYSYWLLWLDRI
jgi:hypothetical protein